MRTRWRPIIASVVACALLAPAVALATAGFLDTVTYTLPAGWTERKVIAKSNPYGHIRLENRSEDADNDHIAGTVSIYWDEAEQYKTFEEFRAGTNPDFAPPVPATPPPAQEGSLVPIPVVIPSTTTTKAESSQTTFKGKSWYYTTVTAVTNIPALSITVPERESRVRTTYYYMNLGGHSLTVIAGTDASDVVGHAYLQQFSDMDAQTLAVVESLTFDFGTDGPSTGDWRTVLAGAGALAAAATALAGAFLRTPEGRRRAKEDPTMVVGHILELSTRSISVTRDQQVALGVRAFRVRANGAYEPAPDAAITLIPPAGVSVAPQTGVGTLHSGVWQTGPLGRPAIMQITAAAEGGSTTQQLPVKSGDALDLSVDFEPAEKISVLADDKDSVTLVARVLPDGGAWAPGSDPGAARASIGFRILGGWLYGSDPADWGADARATRFMARQPDPLHPVVPPECIDVEVSATVGAEQLRKVVSIGIARQPVLEATPDEITLAAESGDSAKVALVVRDPGQPQWHYREQWPENTKPLATCAFVEDKSSTGTLTLTESAPKMETGGPPRVWAKLTVIASAQGYPDVPRDINVGVLREGLFAETVSMHPDGTYHVRADGKKQPQTIVFRAYVRDAGTGRIAATPEYINALKFQPLDDPGTTERASAEFSQLAVEYRVEASAAEREPGGAYSFVYRREVPGKGEVRPVRYLVTAPGLDPDKFWCEIKLGLETEAVEPDSPEWQAEYHRAEDIIRRLMPASYYAMWMQTLQTRSKFLGVEGMAELRKRIWINATELVLAQGAEGYTAEANWADGIVKSLEIAELAGDIAMQYLCSRFLGPAAGQAAQTVKPILTSAIGEYLAGTTPDEWVHMQVAQLGGILESRTVDVAAWEKMRPTARWKLWAIFVCYHFGKAHFWQGQSIMDSIKIAAEQATGVVVMGWAQQKLHQLGGTTAYADAPTPRAKPAGPTAVVAPRARTLVQSGPGATFAKPGKPQRPRVPTGAAPSTSAPESPAAARIRSATKMGPDGIPFADREAVLATMRDPIATRTLKTASPEIQAAFNNTRNQIYREHDAAVLRELRTKPDMKGKRLAVVEVRTANADPDSLNTDHDFHVVEVRTDAATGRTEAIEVKQSRWQAISDKAFAKATGGPADNEVAARKYAKDHQQNPSDEFHGEASPDLAMRGYVKDPDTGQWRQAQVRPNIELVKEGKGVLHDPEALGKTYETKVAEAYKLSKENRGEAYVQAGKAVETMTQVRAGYARQGLTVSQLSPKMRAGMAVVGQGKACFDNPAAVAAADAKLKAAGFRGGLPDFMGKVSGHFEALKWSEPR